MPVLMVRTLGPRGVEKISPLREDVTCAVPGNFGTNFGLFGARPLELPNAPGPPQPT